MADPTETYVEVKDGAFKIRLLQAGTGSPLIYIHGAGGLFWDPLLAGLADRFAVTAPEHPGFGQSQGLEHVPDLWDLIDHCLEELDTLRRLANEPTATTPKGATRKQPSKKPMKKTRPRAT